MERTLPKPRGERVIEDPSLLAHGRYGTDDMGDISGPEKNVRCILDSQVAAVGLLSELYPVIVPPAHAAELRRAASKVDMKRVMELEEQKGHDVIAVNMAWEEQVEIEDAKAHINKIRTSADSTETAKALQCKAAIPVIANSLENLRDITLERALEWSDTVNMETTHLYDAAPAVAGRPFAFYAEMLQSDIDFLGWVFVNSLVGKWADATGNHHSAKALGIDGMELQKKYCEKLGIKHMIAPAQIPGREFPMDVIYALLRSSVTMDNLAHYIRMGRGDDMGIFRFSPKKGIKGSSAMPHKDVKGGNPTAEEQTESYRNFMIGAIATAAASCRFDYCRDLSGSASDRIIFEDALKWGDHVIRNLASVAYRLELNI